MQVSGMSDEDCIRNQLLKLVECPVCYESMMQTEMCINGHTVCSRCRRQLTICPVCNKAFGNIRNRLGEGVAEVLAFKRCTNFVRGCNKFLPERDCQKHVLGCQYRLYKCKLCPVEMCYMELKDHCQTNHQNNLLQPYISQELGDQDTQEGQLYFLLIEFNGELFWFWRKYTKAYLYFGLQYSGEAAKRSLFKYNFQLISKSKKSDFEFTGPVLPDVKSCNIYDNPEDYVILSKAFMGEGAKFQVSLSKV